MKWTMYRWSCLLEALAFGGFLAAYIWKLQLAAPKSWMLIVVWLVASYFLRRDTPKTIGWRGDNLWAATKNAFWFFLVSGALTCLAGLFLGMLQRTPAHVLEWRRFSNYAAFCLLQQVGLNSLVMNRLLAAFERAVPAALVAGAVFGLLHWPNPVLVPLTFVGGMAMSWLFANERNILPLALGQAILGALVWWAFPLAWHHSMRVGPGFRAYRLR